MQWWQQSWSRLVHCAHSPLSFSSAMPSRRQRQPAPASSFHAVSVSEALSRLGMTREQFVAKQAELCAGLLQSQPFMPKSSNAPQLPANDKSKVARPSGRRSRSSSFSSSSSRAPSPSLPRTPARHDRADGPSRPRDQMEMILEGRGRRKATQRRGLLVIYLDYARIGLRRLDLIRLYNAFTR